MQNVFAAILRCVRQSTSQRVFVLSLIVIAGVPRILGALFLPNAFGDAYVYIRDIGAMSVKLRSGTFALADLYGFWLPLFQFVSALFNVVVGNGFYTGKLVAAFFGIGVCLLVYLVTLELTEHRTAALLSFLLIALNPLHVFYSASAMTDVPHAFFVLGALYFCLKQRFIVAAVFAAMAGLTRMESWMLIAAIPAIQFLIERRVSLASLLLLLLPPLFWFYVSWGATGNWRACFQARHEYHDWLLAANPTLAHFSFERVWRDGAMLLVSTDVAVLMAAFVAGWFVLKRLAGAARFSRGAMRALPNGRARAPHVVSDNPTAITPPVIFFFAYFALIALAYLTTTQPIIFPRYGLILFTVGIPILAWTCRKIRKDRPRVARTAFVCVIAICVVDWGVQLAGSIGLLNQIKAQRVVADYLRDHFNQSSSARIFCDDGTVRVMSGIAPEKFVGSLRMPNTGDALLSSLREQKVSLLIITSRDYSTQSRLFSQFKDESQQGTFQLVVRAESRFLPTQICVYRMSD